MRLQISKTKNAESFYIVESTYIQGKRSNRIVEKRGTHEEVKEKAGHMDPYEWARKRAKDLTEEKKNNEINSVSIELTRSTNKDVIKQNRYNCGYLFILEIYYKFGLNKICKDISKKYTLTFDLNEVSV